MIIEAYDDITEMWYDVNHTALWSSGITDFTVKGSRIVSSDNLITCASCDFDFDLAQLGFTKQNWTKFLHRYFEVGAIKKWAEQVPKQTPGSENLLLTLNPRHRWGPCFIGISYRKHPRPRLVLFSRIAILPTTATWELALCSVLARHITDSCRFSWVSGSIWWESLECLPYLIYHDLLEDFIATQSFLSKGAKSAYEGVLSGKHSYEMRRRKVQIALGVKELPPLPVSSLTLDY